MIFNFIRAVPQSKADVYLIASFLTGFLILMENCNLFKNTATDLHKSHELSTAITQVKSAEQKDWLSRSGSVSFHQDSSNMDYSIQIWPKGMFSYSADKGFSGAADKVIVTGKLKTGSVSSDSSSSVQQDKGKIRQQLSQNNKRVFDAKDKHKTTSPSWKWVIGGLAFLGALCCFLYSKIKLFFKHE